jgi:formamidopyrimidine-DNA glycosylase
MPELPEVEITRRNLERWALGRRVVEAQAEVCRLLEGCTAATFRKRLRGRALEDIERRGKYLLATFDGDVGLLCHLGMNGRWLRRHAGEHAPQHARAVLHLDDDQTLFYANARLLGRLATGPVDRLRASPGWSSLGVDPLRDRFTPSVLRSVLAGRRAPVKNVLMDQHRIAGLGNIQAAEALWLARIHPTTPADALDRREVERLHRGILRTLRDTIAESEGDEIEYVGEGGDAPNPFRVYQHEGEACSRCGDTVMRIRMAGRSTFFCPSCQPEA